MEKSISRIYNKFGKTPFTTAIAYELNDIDKNVYKLLEIVKILRLLNIIKCDFLDSHAGVLEGSSDFFFSPPFTGTLPYSTFQAFSALPLRTGGSWLL